MRHFRETIVCLYDWVKVLPIRGIPLSWQQRKHLPLQTGQSDFPSECKKPNGMTCRQGSADPLAPAVSRTRRLLTSAKHGGDNSKAGGLREIRHKNSGRRVEKYLVVTLNLRFLNSRCRRRSCSKKQLLHAGQHLIGRAKGSVIRLQAYNEPPPGDPGTLDFE
jgi:hypothetical protein